MLTREQILAVDDLGKELVEVPEWGGSVYVRMMSGVDREAFEVANAEKKTKVIPLLLACTLCDEAGELMFTPGDVDALNGKSLAALMRLQAAAVRINRIGPGDVDAAEGESAVTPSSSSPSGSPNASA